MSPNGWTYLLKYWLLDRFQATPFDVFSSVDDFPLMRLPFFYASGSSVASDLVVGTGLPDGSSKIVSASCKSCYQLLLFLNVPQLHCVLKFASSFWVLDWPSTWKSLQFMPLEQARDLSWKVAHGVL